MGSIVSKIDAILLKLEDMEAEKFRRREQINTVLGNASSTATKAPVEPEVSNYEREKACAGLCKCAWAHMRHISICVNCVSIHIYTH